MAEIYAGKTEIIKRAEFWLFFTILIYNPPDYDKIIS